MNIDSQNIPSIEDLNDGTEIQSLFMGCGFIDWKTARIIFRRMHSQNPGGLSAIYSFLISALSNSADPDRSLINFERFIEGFGMEPYSTLEKHPRIIEILITIFSASPFLTEILLRSPDSLELLSDRQLLSERKTIEQFQQEVLSAIESIDGEENKLDAMRRYQRQQYLRIGVNDFLGLYDLRSVFSQLSRMAIGLVRACLYLAVQKTGIASGDFSVLAMGKLGGWELNYSSDIDLLFVAKDDADRYQTLAERLVNNIAASTSEGFLYRVDLRLRPWGRDGPLVSNRQAYLDYMQKDARLWEKQAFLKARSIAGNLSFGEELRSEIEPFLFGIPKEMVRSSIYTMKKQTEKMLKDKGRYWGEIKYGEGSIRDIEFIVQYLQLIHPTIRTRVTMKAINRLREDGHLPSEEAHVLAEGYSFLRTIEHYLQIIDYRQNYTLPSDPGALAYLARRLDFDGPQAGEQFVEKYEQHCHAIRSIFLKYVGDESKNDCNVSSEISPYVLQHIARMDSSYTTTFSSNEILLHSQFADKLDNKTIVIVNIEQLDVARWRVTVVGYDFLGELSLICGLMFLYGLDIIECQAFTYEPIVEKLSISQNSVGHNRKERSKIVDVFIVRSIGNIVVTSGTWTKYEDDLRDLLKKVQIGRRREAQGELAKRVGNMFQGMDATRTPLYPIEIEIDNYSSARYTVLNIHSTDTVGFLYEFSNALALGHVNIARMFVQSIGKQVKDTLYVTDDRGQKITSSERQRELRAATVLIKHFTHLLPRSPNPETALLHFREFIAQLFKVPNWPDELVNLEKPDVLDALARLLGVSDFLWDDFLRMQYSNLYPVLRDIKALEISKERRQLEDEVDNLLNDNSNWISALNAFKDREMFRIDMRHILGYTQEFWQFSYELTDLVEIVVNTAYYKCIEDLNKEYGRPCFDDGSLCPSSIVALGKCGGRELGFASDIELMLIYGGDGKTSGSLVISAGEYFRELIRNIVQNIHARQEGIFHIDLQLRPYGKTSSLAIRLDAFQNYFSPGGPAWDYERQALVKLRPIAGDISLGMLISKLRDEYIYNGDPFNITSMRAMRERQIRHLVAARTFNAKYSPGGLVDLEYLIQGLQISCGADNPSLRLTNIRMAMAALADHGIISQEDYDRLRKAHTFFRWLIDSLRVVRGNSKDVNIPPFESEEFSFLARRLRYGSDIVILRDDLLRFSSDVQEISQRLLPSS